MGVRNKSQFFSLPDLFFLQSAVQIIEDRTLGLTPQRSDQQIFRSVSGKTVDDKVRAQLCKTAHHQCKIGVPVQHLKASFPVFFREIRMLQNVKKLKLDSADGHAVQIAHGIQHHFLRFKRKSENRVDDDRNPPPVQFLQSCLKTGKRVSAPDISGGGCMDRLKPQFDPDRFLAIQPFQKFQHIGAQAVRPRRHRQNDNLRIRQCL